MFFLDRFAKTYGENKTLGEEFVGAVVGLSLSRVDKCNYLRTALVATNLVAEKVVDGIARLIFKSDIDKIQSPNKRVGALEADACIKMAWTLADNACQAGHISQDSFDDIVGKIMFRMVLFLVEKQKLSPEKIEFQDIADIRSKFCSDMKIACGDALASIIDLGDWGETSTPVVDVATGVAVYGSEVLLSMEEQNDPLRIFTSHGFKIGDYVKERGIEGAHIFKITEFNAGKIELAVFDVFQENVIAASVQLDKFLDGWVIHSSKLPKVIDIPVIVSTTINDDCVRADCLHALAAYEKLQLTPPHALSHKVPVKRNIQYLMFPQIIAATADMPKNSIKLAPLTTMSNISLEKKKGAAEINVGNGRFVYATQPAKPTSELELKDFIYTPFWWVGKSHNLADINMNFIVQKVDGVSFPVLTNIRLVHKNERLYYFVAKEEKVALQGADVKVKSDEAPSKRQKKSDAKKSDAKTTKK